MDFNQNIRGSDIIPEIDISSPLAPSTIYAAKNQDDLLSTSAKRYSITSNVEGATLKNSDKKYGITFITQEQPKEGGQKIRYSGKNIEIPPDLGAKKIPMPPGLKQKDHTSSKEPDASYQTVADLYKETLAKYKIKDAEISFGEFISLLYGSLDQKSEKTQYKTALEIGIAKYLKENTGINRHNTDILRIFEGNDTEVETYKQETKAYMEILEKQGIVTKIDKEEAFVPVIRTENFEVDTWTKAITSEATKYMGDIIKKAGSDTEILNHMDSIHFKPPIETKIDTKTLKETYPIITDIGDIPQLTPPTARP